MREKNKEYRQKKRHNGVVSLFYKGIDSYIVGLPSMGYRASLSL